jgi:GNAT superfamily N-acetyltransferase
MAVEIRTCRAGDAIRCARLTYQHLRPLLAQCAVAPHAVGLVAEHQGVPVGLVLGTCTPPQSQILSLYVAPAFRRRGIATRLLQAFEDLVTHDGAQTITAGFPEQVDTAKALLSACGWPVPRVAARIYTCERERMLQWPGLSWPAPRPPLTFCPVVPIAADLKATIDQGYNRWYPAYLYPYHPLDRLDPDSSLFLTTTDGSPQGWCVAQRVATDTLLYHGVFVRDEIRHLGQGPTLIAEAIRRQLAGRVQKGMFAVRADNRGMQKLVDKWLMPYVSQMRVRWESTKPL